MRTLLAWVLMTGVAWGAETCATVDLTGWSQDEQNRMTTTANELADAAINPHPLAVIQENRVCFETPNFDLGATITTSAMHSQFLADDARLQARNAAEALRQQGFRDEVNTNTLCAAELAVLDARIDAGVEAITDLASAKTFLRQAFKKVARCLRARAAVSAP